MVLYDYAYVLLFLIAGVVFTAAAFVTSWFLRPNKPNPTKLSSYECGIPAKGNSWIQFNVRYYVIALIFVVFDVEALFIVPWAVVFRQLGMLGFMEMLVFIFILAVGLLYAWKKGALEWL